MDDKLKAALDKLDAAETNLATAAESVKEWTAERDAALEDVKAAADGAKSSPPPPPPAAAQEDQQEV